MKPKVGILLTDEREILARRRDYFRCRAQRQQDQHPLEAENCPSTETAADIRKLKNGRNLPELLKELGIQGICWLTCPDREIRTPMAVLRLSRIHLVSEVITDSVREEKRPHGLQWQGCSRIMLWLNLSDNPRESADEGRSSWKR